MPVSVRCHPAPMVMAIVLALAATAHATVFMTQPQALAQAFPGARIERRSFVLTDAQVKAVEGRAKVRVESKLVNAYVAWRGDTLVGTGLFDVRVVRTMPAVMLVAVRPDTTVARVDFLAFHEPPDYQPPARWLATFAGRPLDERLWPQRDIRNLSGATLSTRAVTETVRLALALYAQVVGPTLGARPLDSPLTPRRDR
jgi:hypothetical protein